MVKPKDEPDSAMLRAGPGTRVEVELIDDRDQAERLAFDIVPDASADFNHGFLGAGTPLAQAIAGRAPGAVVPYRRADIRQVRIVAIRPSTRAAAPDAAERRQALADEAVSKSQHEDAVRLALTVDVKWGDYDPEGLEPDEE